MTESWFQQRITNVSIILSHFGQMAREIAWDVGTLALIVAYPLALGILDDRVAAQYS